ncbi:hypothetical protein PENARI_c003G08007 [Penicillium arizonense]|uniref:Uncharacterized protein n=1 Tax=Penicillium arizonense TaxID=1835702 RepID=A0A1F5LT44_PENAI|nr:hypothetical protein PENARI_c003G08007 [Penicillium arizonense]OGE56382.1 hypothetical protein PENARI_c003G08007 [Penicillium arizonense]
MIDQSAKVFDYLKALSDKWTKPSQDIELISDEFDREYMRQYVQNPPPGRALGKPKAPRYIKQWGLRTLWCYWIDKHLDLIEQVQSAWHGVAKSKMESIKSTAATKFASQTTMTGDAAVDRTLRGAGLTHFAKQNQFSYTSLVTTPICHDKESIWLSAGNAEPTFSKDTGYTQEDYTRDERKQAMGFVGEQQ